MIHRVVKSQNVFQCLWITMNLYINKGVPHRTQWDSCVYDLGPKEPSLSFSERSF